MKKMIKIAGIAAVALILVQSVQAIPVTGAIGFTGAVQFNTSSAGTASAVTTWVNPAVTLDSGAFTIIPLTTAATFSAAVWNFVTTSPTLPFFWTVSNGTSGFQFVLNSSSVTAQGPGFVVVNGTGTVTATGLNPLGYTATTLSWSFTSQDPASSHNPDQWTFSASANSIPDGGATVMLLGIALSGVALLRKKLTA
jgi:hypothetical protein